jgi:hypothetical protein
MRSISGGADEGILEALGDSSSDEPKAGSLHKRLDGELGIADRGFATAFPFEVVGEDLDDGCERVIDEAAEVADAAWSDVRREEESRMSARFHEERVAERRQAESSEDV